MIDIPTLEEIARLHDEAMEHALSFDGHCKSSEGFIQVGFNNAHDRRENGGRLEVKGVAVYSYVLGPNRMHYFDTAADALSEVVKWHRNAMTLTERDFL